MIYENVRGKFGKWDKYWKEFIESEEMDKLFRYIKSRAGSTKILPESSNVFRCFKDTDPDKLKCIICGIAPYHTTYKKAGEVVSIADGLALSCGSTWKDKGLQPSLEQIYTDMSNTYNETIDVDMDTQGDLQYLSDQGVLLYNIALTVEENKPLSMNPAWEKFNEYMWRNIIDVYWSGIPILYLGVQAHKSVAYLTPMRHYPMILPHPASANYKEVQWDSGGVWKKIDKILMDNNKETIEWYKKRNYEKPTTSSWEELANLPTKVRTDINWESNLPWE